MAIFEMFKVDEEGAAFGGSQDFQFAAPPTRGFRELDRTRDAGFGIQKSLSNDIRRGAGYSALKRPSLITFAQRAISSFR